MHLSGIYDCGVIWSHIDKEFYTTLVIMDLLILLLFKFETS